VNPRYIRQLVHTAFYPPRTDRGHGHRPATAGGQVTVDVYNGTTTYHLAADVLAALVKGGYRRGTAGNTATRAATAVRYGPGAAGAARAIATLFGVTAAPRSSGPAGHVHVLLGAGATVPRVTPAASPATQVSAPPSSGPQGGTVKAGKKDGIPCVD